MPMIIGLHGSLRQGSFNGMLLQAAVDLAPDGSTIVAESIRDIPLYDADAEERHGIPAAVQRLKNRIAEADGLLIATPEYNSSLPGVLKNAVDWLSRPDHDIPRVFGGRPVAIMGATTGIGGTVLAQAAWMPVFRKLGMRPWCEGSLFVSNAHGVFDLEGRLTDVALRDRLRRFVGAFAGFVAGQPRRHPPHPTVTLAGVQFPTHARHVSAGS